MPVEGLMRRAHWLLYQIGVDPVKAARALWTAPRFVRNWFQFRSQYSGEMRLLPCLHDWWGEAGEIRHEYFWQDLFGGTKDFPRQSKETR